MGLYTLSVEVSDNAGNQASAPVTVDVLPPLFLADILSFSARVGQAVSLYTFSTTDRVGAQTYILAAGNEEGYFSLDAGWVLSVSNKATVGMYQLRLEGSDRAGNQATAVVKVRITRDGIFVLGGHKGDVPLNDVWSSADGKSWMQDGDGGWSARYGHQAVVHQGRLYVLGGLDGNGSDRNDVWSLVINSWEQGDDAGWSIRSYHQAVSHNGRIYVLGGENDSGYYNDVWSSADGESWSLETAAAGWSARHGHQAVSHNGRLYVLGGIAGTSRNDVWSSVDGKSWSLEIADGAGDWAEWHKAVSHNGRIYVLGGYGNGENHDDVWSSVDGKNWRQEMVAGWPGRWGIQAVSYQGRLYVLGGNDGSGFNNDVWSWADGESWTLETADAGWSRRFNYQAVAFPPPLILLGTGARLRLTVGLSSANIYTFQAQYGVGDYTYSLSPAEAGFSIDNHGVLSADGNTPMGSYRLIVQVEDETGMSAKTEAHVDVALPALPLLTVLAGKIIYTFTVVGGIGEKTYTIVAGNDAQHFTLGGASGNLSVRADGETGKYTLQVKISDSRGDYAAGAVTVEVVPPLSLAGVSLTGWARLSVAMVLHDFTVNSGIGAKRYTLVAGNDAGYFALDEISGVLSLLVNQGRLAGDYTLFLAVSDSATPPNRATAAVNVRLEKSGIFVLGGDEGEINNKIIYRNDVWSAVGGKNWRQEQENNEAGRWSARDYHQAVSHQGRLYVLGGSDGVRKNDVWSSADGKSWRQDKASDEQGWSKRFRHQAVWHQGLLYVLGGYDGGYRNDVWSSADGVSWTEETSAAEWPARANHQVVVHNGRLYVLGGWGGGVAGYYNDVWSSADGVSWTAEAAAAWSARSALQAVSHQGRLYVLGGGYDGGYYNDVWSSAFGETWRQEKADDGQGWSGRHRHQVVSRGGLLYVVGGAIGTYFRNDVWSSSAGKNWTVETAAAGWSVRRGHQAVVFPPPLVLLGVGERLRLRENQPAPNIHTFTAQSGVGKYTYSLSTATDGFSIGGSGVLSADGSTQPGNYTLTVWVEDEEGSRAQTAVRIDVVIFALSEVPPLFALAGRAEVIYTFAVMDGMKNQTYTLAAGNEDGYFSLGTSGTLSVTEEAAAGLYTLSVEVSDSAGNQTSALVTVDVLPPLFVADTLSFSARVGQAVSLYTFSTTDRVGVQTYILAAGNEAGHFSLDAGWVLSVSNSATLGMYQLLLEGSDIAGNQATAVVKVRIIRDGIFVLGGIGVSIRLNDMWSSADGNSWMPEGNGGWSARNGHQAVVHQGRLHVLGGLDDNGTRNDVWSLVISSWVQADNAGWSARYYHQAVSHNERLYVLGGATSPNDNEYLSDVWSSADGTIWSQETATAGWSGRVRHQAVSHQGRLYVLGGIVGNGGRNDVWSSVDGKSWRQETAAAAWQARARHQAVSHQGRLYVLGGFKGGRLRDVWSSVDGKSWTQETATAGWSGRLRHQAVSYNGRLYVLGGFDGNPLHDVWSSVDGKSWSQEADASWSGRQEHQAVVFPQPLVLLGVNTRFRLTVGLSSSNIYTFQARYGTGNYTYSLLPAEAGLSIDNHGVLSADGNTPMGSHTLTVQVEDETGSSAQTALPVDVALAALPLLTALLTALDGKMIYTLTVGGGIGEKTYAIEGGDGAQYFMLGGASGKLWVRAEVEAGKYTLQVKISDSRGDYAAGAITVKVLTPLSLAGVSLAGWARLPEVVTLHDFAVRSGIGAKRYTLVAGYEAGYFALDEISGVLSLPVNQARLAGDYTLFLAVSDSDEPPKRVTAMVKVRLEKSGIFVLGGITDLDALRNDVWSSFDGRGWREEKASNNTGWLARYRYQALLHRGRLYVLGGHDGSRRNDVWSSLDGRSWRQEKANNNAGWSPRENHQAVSHNQLLYVLGGFDDTKKSDVWSSADGKSWTLETGSAGWSSRERHRAVSYNGRLYVLGGLDGSAQNDVWSSVDGKSWRQETAAAAWPVRRDHQVVSHNERLYVLGGATTAGSRKNDVWSSADGKSWRQEKANNSAGWRKRRNHQAVSYEGRLYVLGGFDGGRRNDVWSSADGRSWVEEAEAGWSARQDHQAVVFPQPLALPGVVQRHVVAGLLASNIHTFEAKYGRFPYAYSLSPAIDGFSIDESHGVLSADGSVQPGNYALTVWVEDEDGTRAKTEVHIDVVIFGGVPLLFALSGRAEVIYTFDAMDEMKNHTYTFAAGNGDGYFSLGTSGTLSVTEAAAAGLYTLSVKISDSAGNQISAPVTVDVLPPLFVTDTLSFTVRVGQAVSLYTFSTTDRVGAQTYSLAAGNEEGYFSLGADWVLSVSSAATVGMYQLLLEGSDREDNQVTAVVRVRIIRDGIFVLGGLGGGGARNDVWSADGNSWMSEGNGGWSARNGHQAVVHQGRLHVLGGLDDNARNDVWSLVTISWEQGDDAGWSARYYHQAVSHNKRLYVLGGVMGGATSPNDREYLNDVWSSADGTSWSQETAAADWSARQGHQAVSHQGRLYVLGGIAGNSDRNDVWSSVDGKSWRQEKAAAAWPVRVRHQAVSHQGRLYVLGGNDGLNNLNDVWSSADGKSWRQEKANDGQGWSARQRHQAVSYRDRLYVLGGNDVSNNLNDVWSSVDGKSWMLVTMSAAWSARAGHQAVVFPQPLVLLGVNTRFRLTVGLSSSNIYTFQARYGAGNYTYSLSPAEAGFSIDDHGVLSADGNTPTGSHTLTVQVEDETGSLAQIALPVDVALPALPLLTALAGNMIYTLTVDGGIGEKTYAIEEGDGAQYFTLGSASGKLSVRAEAEAGKYTLQVKISDSRGDYAAGAITVQVVPPLSLAGVSLTGWARLSVAMTLHDFAVSNGAGIKRYTLVAGNEAGYFALDEISGVLSLPVNQARLAGDYTLSLAVSDSDEPPKRVTAMVKVRLEKNGIFVLGGDDGARKNDVWWSADGKSWREETAAAWPARSYHQAVSHQGRLYVLGGYDGVGSRNDVWSSVDGKSWRQETAAAAWSARYSHQVVSHRGLLYVLGGVAGSSKNDVWSSADGKSWTEETAAAWPKRFSHQVVSHRGRLYVLGGFGKNNSLINTYYNDVWSSVDGKSWREETATAAWSARYNYQAVSRDGLLYVLGGYDGSGGYYGGRLNDVWSSADGKSWTEETAAAAWSARRKYQAVLRDGRLYVLGGFDGNTKNDVWWSADGKSWREETAAAWSARQEHQAVVFPSPLVLFGLSERLRLTLGMSSSNVAALQAQYGGGAYTYSLSSAEIGLSIDNHGVLSADGSTPMGSYTLTVWVEDEEGSSAQTELPVDVALAELPLLTTFAGKMIYTLTVGGGIGEKTYAIEEGDGAQYFTLGGASGKLSVRAEAEAGKYTLQVKISDSSGDYAAGAITVEVATPLSLAGVSLTGWARLSVAVTLHDFAVRSGIGAKRYTLVAGNDAGYFALDEISGVLSLPVNPARLAGNYTLSLAVSDSDEPPNRATAVVKVRLAKNGIFVLGGDDGSQRLNDVWSSADGKSWAEETAAAWSARERHQAVSHRGRLYVLGGNDGGRRNDVWSSADGKSWREETAAAAWSARQYHQAVSHRGRLYVLGGHDGGRLNDVWSSTDGKSWTEETAAGWMARQRHQAVSHNGRLYVLGGIGGGKLRLNDVWSSADGKSWREETAAAAWSARQRHQAVSHRGRLYVLGGIGGGNNVWSSADGKSWREETAAAAWSERRNYQAVSRDGRLYVLGGLDGNYRNDVWWSVDGKSWTEETAAAWMGRDEYQAVVFPSPLALLGAGERILLTSGISSSNLATFQAQYGVGAYTYSLVSEVSGFSIDESSGVLSVDGSVAVGRYTLTLWVEDEEGSQAQTAVDVDVVAASTAALSAGSSIISPPASGGGASALALAGGGLSLLIITPPASSLARPRTPPQARG